MKLPEAERLIMSILWDAKRPLTLFEVDEIARKRYNKKWKIQTIATFMTRLKKKGFISVDKIERYHYYEAIIKMETYANQEVNDIVTVLFNNDKKCFKTFVNSL